MGKRRRRTVDQKGRTPEGQQYLKASYRMLQSDAWRSLSGPAVKVFLELRTRYNGGNNGQLHLSMDEAKRLLGMGKATVQRAFTELQDRGLIRMTKRGQWYGRQATEWAVTDCPVNGSPATNDWKDWRLPKTNPRSSDGTMTTPDGSASGPKNDRRFRLRTGESPSGDSDGSASGPLIYTMGRGNDGA